MKNHIKRLAAPKTWLIDKSVCYAARPNPGAHCLMWSLPLGVVLRDFLHIAPTMGDIRKTLHRNEILVDGKQRKDYRYNVGLFDVISLPLLQKYYRITLDSKARLTMIEIPVADSSLKICKVVGKTVLAGGKIQIHLHDSRNIISDVKMNVGDSVLLQLPEGKIQEVLPLIAGASVFLVKGKHGGSLGNLKDIKGKEATYKCEDQEINTAKDYLFVVGKQKPAMHLHVHNVKK